jgi:hypothetical protein
MVFIVNRCSSREGTEIHDKVRITDLIKKIGLEFPVRARSPGNSQ